MLPPGNADGRGLNRGGARSTSSPSSIGATDIPLVMETPWEVATVSVRTSFGGGPGQMSGKKGASVQGTTFFSSVGRGPNGELGGETPPMTVDPVKFLPSLRSSSEDIALENVR
jgi:hypothetical protein